MSDKEDLAESQVSEESLPVKSGMASVQLPTHKPDPSGVGQTSSDRQFQMFMNPMFAELESRVKEQEQILDRINDQMKKEKEERIKEKEQAHIPVPLKGGGKDLSEVMQKVEDLIVYEIGEDEPEEAQQKEEETFSQLFQQWLEQRRQAGIDEGGEEEVEEGREPQEMVKTHDEEPKEERKQMPIHKLDSHGQAAVTAHSLAAYVSCLSQEHLKKFTAKITADCQLWLSKMFRFDDASVFYHEEARDGLVRVCRLAMYQKYPKYVTEGFEALYARPPVIYFSAAAPPNLCNYVCLQLGLPLSSVCSVPCNTLFGCNTKMRPHKHERMDTEILEKLILDDIAAAKTPVALIAYAGTPNGGHVDDLETIKDLCKKHNIWMHVEGDTLATLALLSPPSNITDARFGDSFTLCIGKWLGIPAIPFATLFKVSDPTLVYAASLMTFNPTLKLNCLPLWVVLQSLGIEQIVKRITSSCDLAEMMLSELAKIKTIKQFSREEKKKEDRAIRSITELISKAISALLVFEIVVPSVVFRYTESQTESKSVAVAPYAVGSSMDVDDESDEETLRKKKYYNSLNIWLAETLQSENPKIGITIVELEREGVCMKFSPLETAQVLGTTKEHVGYFIASLQKNLEILDATTLNYEKFRLMAAETENLQLIEVPDWAGLGAVQYVPSAYLSDHLDEEDEMAKKEINSLNEELVQKLKESDSAFSLGYTDCDTACVKFGLITDDTDIRELLNTVQTMGKEVEESSKYFETMSELVRKGIEEANKDLEEENQHKLMQEGVLRQLPMIGSMMNWWSPPPKDIVKGRTFNLVSGTIASTEETYKYKMQVQSGDGSKTSPRTRKTSETGSVSSISSSISQQSHQAQASPRTPTSPKVQQTVAGPCTVGPGIKPGPGVSKSGVNGFTLTTGEGHSETSTKTAGDVKAGLVHSINDGDLSESHESLPSPNGNLRLNLEAES